VVGDDELGYLTPYKVWGLNTYRLEKKMVCENYENCGNFLYNFESYIESDDGKFISRKYYCPSCYKEQDTTKCGNHKLGCDCTNWVEV